MILIITNKQDTHPTPVIECLKQKGISVFRLNTECLLTDYEFEWHCGSGGSDFHIRNIKNGLELYGHELTAVWERRPMLPETLPIKSRKEVDKHNLEEAGEFLSYLLHYVSDTFSIGHHLYDRSADSKMTQLRVASKLGMSVPDTLFSNRKKDTIAFAKRYGNVVLKQISNSSLWLGGEYEYVFYTQRVSAKQLEVLPDETFIQTANFIQNYIPKQFELRVTVVCNDVFACKIDSQEMDVDKGAIDWRQGYDYGLRHEKYDLPEHVADFCRNYLREMKLNFGCFDFVVTPDGGYVFLECNPNGQWLWVEIATGLKISESIARHLSKAE